MISSSMQHRSESDGRDHYRHLLLLLHALTIAGMSATRTIPLSRNAITDIITTI